MTRQPVAPATPPKGDWFLTASGCQFYPTDPQRDQIRLWDIAHALSNICRFGGHARTFYSVAQHSIHVSQILEARYPGQWNLIMGGLMHDSPEAYIGDMVRPLKVSQPHFVAAEDNLWTVIADRFALSPKLPHEVKWADDVALMTERRDLVISHPRPWTPRAEPDAVPIVPLPAGAARSKFLERFFIIDAFRNYGGQA